MDVISVSTYARRSVSKPDGESTMFKPSFAALERLLIHLGFQARSVPESHLLFEHPGANVRIMLRPYKAEEPVEPAALAYVRRTLDEWGILDRDRFEEELRQRSMAG